MQNAACVSRRAAEIAENILELRIKLMKLIVMGEDRIGVALFAKF